METADSGQRTDLARATQPRRAVRATPRTAGPLTREQHDLFLRNPRFNGLKFPDMRNPETLERKYGGKMPQDALSFIK